jgi:hypothetical protein
MAPSDTTVGRTPRKRKERPACGGGSTGRKSFLPERQLRKELKQPVAIVVAQFLLSLFQAQTPAEKNRRELKGLVELDSKHFMGYARYHFRNG